MIGGCAVRGPTVGGWAARVAAPAGMAAVAPARTPPQGLVLARAADPADRGVRAGRAHQDVPGAGVLHPVRLDGAHAARLPRVLRWPRAGQPAGGPGRAP